MLKFVNTPKTDPKKKSSELRSKDFNEIYLSYVNQKAKEQASRCSQCGYYLMKQLSGSRF